VRPFDARAKTVLATGLIALSRRGAREDPLRWSVEKLVNTPIDFPPWSDILISPGVAQQNPI